MPAVPKARTSSHMPTPNAMTTTRTNASFTNHNDARTMAMSATATPIAAGRLRPARPCGFASVVSSDLKKFSLFVLQELIDHVDVLLGESVQPLLRAGVLVLADLRILLGAIEGLLGAAAQVANRHPAVLGLGLRQLDYFPQSIFGKIGQDNPACLSVVARVYTEVGHPDRLLDRALRIDVV